MSDNTDLLWIFMSIFFSVAAVAAVLAVVGLTILVRDGAQRTA